MIKKLNEINSGYWLNGNIINNILYENNTELYSPYKNIKVLILFINCCEYFANYNHIKLNIVK